MKKVGVLGGGQLARMLALAGYPLNIAVIAYEPIPDTCAAAVTQVMQGSYDDEIALTQFAAAVDCVTLETENIPVACAQFIAQHTSLMPSVEVLRVTQDRLLEKELLQSLNIPTANYSTSHFTSRTFPAILKTRRNGYDGKGQIVLRHQDEVERAVNTLAPHELILEEFVSFDFEVSLISVSSAQHGIKFYPLVMNQHEEGILRVSTAPLLNASLQQQAEEYARRIIANYHYIGVMTMEFFVVGEQLIANEIAPRVHNSGHWTIEGAVTSQFENHLRAVCGLPLGNTAAIGRCTMTNMIGVEPAIEEILAIPNAHYHSYGKEARPGRKLGHVTVMAAVP